MALTSISLTHKLDKEISTLVRRSRIDKKFLSSDKNVTYSEFLSDKLLMMLIIRKGIPYSFFNLIQTSRRSATTIGLNSWESLPNHYNDISNFQRTLGRFYQKK